MFREESQIAKSILFRFLSVCIGVILFLSLLEFSFRVAGIFLKTTPPSYAPVVKERLIIFSGDSWTAGRDANRGQGFFDLLKKDDSFKDFSLVNLGRSAHNPFQIVNSVIDYKQIPRIVVLDIGVNDWHLMGLKEFLDHARAYFSAKDIAELCKDFKINTQLTWFKELKIYKLYYYLINRRGVYMISLLEC